LRDYRARGSTPSYSFRADSERVFEAAEQVCLAPLKGLASAGVEEGAPLKLDTWLHDVWGTDSPRLLTFERACIQLQGVAILKAQERPVLPAAASA